MKKELLARIKAAGFYVAEFTCHNQFWWRSYEMVITKNGRTYEGYTEYHICEVEANGLTSKQEALNHFDTWLNACLERAKL